VQIGFLKQFLLNYTITKINACKIKHKMKMKEKNEQKCIRKTKERENEKKKRKGRKVISFVYMNSIEDELTPHSFKCIKQFSNIFLI
jgi:hypothetical protein